MNNYSKFKYIPVVLSVLLVIICFTFSVRFLSYAVKEYNDNEFIVCIDPGHGGSDSGATTKDNLRKEKDDNLMLSLKIKNQLENNNIKVIMTRTTDITVDLKDRCKKANKRNADLFIAVHRNSSANGTGVEAWISKEEKGNEKILAEKITESLSQITKLENRGVKHGYRNSNADNFYINANTNMPSILLETGFISNNIDNKIYDRKINIIAEDIANNIIKYEQKNKVPAE